MLDLYAVANVLSGLDTLPFDRPLEHSIQQRLRASVIILTRTPSRREAAVHVYPSGSYATPQRAPIASRSLYSPSMEANPTSVLPTLRSALRAFILDTHAILDPSNSGQKVIKIVLPSDSPFGDIAVVPLTLDTPWTPAISSLYTALDPLTVCILPCDPVDRFAYSGAVRSLQALRAASKVTSAPECEMLVLGTSVPSARLRLLFGWTGAAETVASSCEYVARLTKANISNTDAQLGAQLGGAVKFIMMSPWEIAGSEAVSVALLDSFRVQMYEFVRNADRNRVKHYLGESLPIAVKALVAADPCMPVLGSLGHSIRAKIAEAATRFHAQLASNLRHAVTTAGCNFGPTARTAKEVREIIIPAFYDLLMPAFQRMALSFAEGIVGALLGGIVSAITAVRTEGTESLLSLLAPEISSSPGRSYQVIAM